MEPNRSEPKAAAPGWSEMPRGATPAGTKSPHPKPWVRRMAERRGLHPPEKTLYWWSVHLDRFLVFCRKLGPKASEIPEMAARQFLDSIAGTSANAAFASEQARQALDVFLQETEHWHWSEREGERPGRAFRLKATAEAGRSAVVPTVASPDGEEVPMMEAQGSVL